MIELRVELRKLKEDLVAKPKKEAQVEVVSPALSPNSKQRSIQASVIHNMHVDMCDTRVDKCEIHVVRCNTHIGKCDILVDKCDIYVRKH